MDSVERIMQLFDGYDRVHGTYTTKRVNERGKVEGQALTVTGPAGYAEWHKHLAGEGAGLGIIPLRADDTVKFAAIDIDKYNLDHAKLEEQTEGYPLTICRSKSGGAHLYLFLKEPEPARDVVEVLSRWAAELGYGNCEIFPKQTYRTDERDIGNWINMPWFNAKASMRYAFANGRALSLEEFLDLAEQRRATLDEILQVVPKTEVESKIYEEGPPCLQYLKAHGGFPEGTRNEGMFNVAVYLKRRFGDGWADKLPEYNKAMCSPALGLREISTIAKTHEKKEYGYRCKQAPIHQHCNRRVCLQREYGVGETSASGNRVEITGLIKYDGDPVLWGVDIGGQRVLVDTDTLYSQAKFNRMCMEKISRCPSMLPAARWLRYLDGKVKDADVILAPEDASPAGQFYILFEKFCHGRIQARRKEEILNDKPWNDSGLIHFTSRALMKYLEDQRYDYKSEHHIWLLLRQRGCDKKFDNIRGKGVNVWFIPEPQAAEPEQPQQMSFVGQEEEF